MKQTLFLLLVAGAILGQSSPELRDLSIRPHVGPRSIPSFTVDGEVYRAVGVTLADLVMLGYGVRPTQLAGRIQWMTSEQFDIEAKASGVGAPSWKLAKPMLQAILVDRFRLKVHQTTLEVPAYDLLVANGGPRFTEHSDPAWFEQRFTQSSSSSAVHIVATRTGLARLASVLTTSTDHPVVDKTGLEGAYDFKLDWAPDYSPAAMDGSAPTLFRALQEQLGLKLEPSVTRKEILVIESADKPSAN